MYICIGLCIRICQQYMHSCLVVTLVRTTHSKTYWTHKKKISILFQWRKKTNVCIQDGGMAEWWSIDESTEQRATHTKMNVRYSIKHWILNDCFGCSWKPNASTKRLNNYFPRLASMLCLFFACDCSSKLDLNVGRSGFRFTCCSLWHSFFRFVITTIFLTHTRSLSLSISQ